MAVILMLISCVVVAAQLQVAAEECKDSDYNCPKYPDWCKRGGAVGELWRKKCPLTCGVCHRPTLTPGKTQPPHHGGCGRPDVSGITRVIAGKTATPHSWPWQILMKLKGKPICGGTLIGPQHVLTAAHCVYRREGSGGFAVVVGEHDREKFEGMEEEIKVTKVYRHAKYNPYHMNYDIAMFKLERPVKFNKYVSPACLPKANVPPGTDCYITGWGKMQHPGHMVRYLQQGLLPVVSNKVCYEKNKVRLPTYPITDTMICGGSGGSKRTSGCHGDSGGPFVCHVNGVWELHGQVSHGSPSCNSKETYTVFSRTYFFLDWIKENMRK